ncbi:MAG TPA: GNAT family protein [Thermomicrobiales bacterium]|nr:GNAT family protein [Thermomicrobiales bacterium]
MTPDSTHAESDRRVTDARPLVTIEGDKIALGPIRRDLLPLYQAWINDLSVTRFLVSRPMSLDEEISWYEGVVNNERMVFFTIYERSSYRPIGGVDLHGIDVRNRTAELGIMIGERDARGRGLGTEAVRLVCDYGFNAMELNSIWLLTFGWNIAGQKAYVKAGFREFGRRRQARYFDGRYWDDIYYDLLREEFESPVVHEIMSDGVSGNDR